MRPEFPMNMVVTLQEVCNVLCIDLNNWSGRSIIALSLKYEYRVLNSIVSTNIDPKKYTYQVSYDRVLLMYAIGTRKSIDIVNYIYNTILLLQIESEKAYYFSGV